MAEIWSYGIMVDNMFFCWKLKYKCSNLVKVDSTFLQECEQKWYDIFLCIFLKFLSKYKIAWPLLKYAQINLNIFLVASEVYVQPSANAGLTTPTFEEKISGQANVYVDLSCFLLKRYMNGNH